MGMILAAPLIILEGVGHVLDFQSGLSNAAVYDPATNDESGPFGRVFSQVAVWILFGPLGAVALVTVLLYSYELWPVFASGKVGEVLGYKPMVQASNQALRAILTLAAPAVAALVLVELALGLVGHFTPQFDVNISAMPLKTLVAVAIAALTLSYLLDMLREERSWSDRALQYMRDSTVQRMP